MKAKDKAIDLINKYLSLGFKLFENYLPVPLESSKQCAIITINEMIQEQLSEYSNDENHDRIIYLNEVKREIEIYKL